jgi:hypothetical protein
MPTDAPLNGITVYAHVANALADMVVAIRTVESTARQMRRLKPAEREALRRQLAGLQASAETVKLWLDAGAPLG